MTFEQINTLSAQWPNSVLNELNAHSEDYYNKFLWEWHTYITEQCPFSENNESWPFLSSDWTSIYFDWNWWRYFYNNKNKTIEWISNLTRWSRSWPC